MDKVIERFKEPSSWRGLVLVLTAIGVPISPAHAEIVISLGIGITGLIGVLTSDKK